MRPVFCITLLTRASFSKFQCTAFCFFKGKFRGNCEKVGIFDSLKYADTRLFAFCAACSVSGHAFSFQKTKDLFSRLSSRAARRGRWLFPFDNAKVLPFSKLPKFLLFFFSFCAFFLRQRRISRAASYSYIYIKPRARGGNTTSTAGTRPGIQNTPQSIYAQPFETAARVPV